jgi:hypothetical protein
MFFGRCGWEGEFVGESAESSTSLDGGNELGRIGWESLRLDVSLGEFVEGRLGSVIAWSETEKARETDT